MFSLLLSRTLSAFIIEAHLKHGLLKTLVIIIFYHLKDSESGGLISYEQAIKGIDIEA
jgi:hypothetical protein